MNEITNQSNRAVEWTQERKEFFDHVAAAVHASKNCGMDFHEAVRHFAVMLHALCPDEWPRSLGERLDQ